MGEFTAGRLTAATLARIEQDLLPLIAECDRAAHRQFVGLDLDVPDDVAGWWGGLDGGVRRSVVGALVESVTIRPTRKGSRSFDPEHVSIEWRR